MLTILGIDVQGELRLKGSPHLGPVRNRPMGGQTLPMQKAMLNRQQNARQQRPQMAPPPIQTVNQPARTNMMGDTMNSPLTQPTPPSQRSSPSTTRSPGYPMQAMASPTSDLQPRQFQHPPRQMQGVPQQAFQHQQHRMHNRSMSANTIGQSYPRRSMHAPISHTQTQYYPASFQKHYDQLGKSTPTHPFLFLLESCVRPRLNPLVQTRNTTHKLICLTMSTARTWTQTASYQTSDCRRKLGVILVWACKHHHQPQPQRQVTEATLCRQSHSTMTLCSMLIHSVSAHPCTSRIPSVGSQPQEGRVGWGVQNNDWWSSFESSGVFGHFRKVRISEGAMVLSNLLMSKEFNVCKGEHFILQDIICPLDIITEQQKKYRFCIFSRLESKFKYTTIFQSLAKLLITRLIGCTPFHY